MSQAQRVERLPFSGRCSAEVTNKRLRRFNSGTEDYVCNLVTDMFENGEWRCRHHISRSDDPPTFLVLGVFDG